MRHTAALLRTLGRVVTFDYPYMARGARTPDPRPKLVAFHRQVIERAGAPVVLVGKSMGSRIGCHVAAENPELATACICLGYPLVGAARAGKPGKVRDEVLLELRVPILFVQGSRDPLCPLDRLARVRRRMQAANELVVVEEGDHSLELTATRLRALGRTPRDVDSDVVRAIREFLENHDI